MSKKKFKFVLPDAAKLRAASRTPVKIRNSKLSVVQVVDLDELVSLQPGYYAAEIALPDGSEFEAAFEVPQKGKVKDVVLALAEDQDALAATSQHLQQRADTGVDAAVDAAADDSADERPSLIETMHFDLNKMVQGTDSLDNDGPDLAGLDNDAIAQPGPGPLGGLPGPLGGLPGPLGLPHNIDRSLTPITSRPIFTPGPELSQVTIRHRLGQSGQLQPASAFEEDLIARSSFIRPSTKAPPARISVVQAIPGVETQLSDAWVDTGGQIFIDPISIPNRKNLWLRLGVDGSPDRNIALPVSYNEGAAFELEAENQSWRFILSDPDANAALGYLRHRRIAELTWLAAQNGPIWHAMFNADVDRPIAGTIGAYALLLTGGMERGKGRWSWDWSIHLQWSQQLVQNREAPADALAIHGELLARQGQYDEAMDSFWQISDRGFPIFSIGLRLMVDRLLSCRSKKVSSFDNSKIETMIERFGTLSNYVDFDQPVLSFTTNQNGTFGVETRQAAKEVSRSLRDSSS